jgi:hypothetical protein
MEPSEYMPDYSKEAVERRNLATSLHVSQMKTIVIDPPEWKSVSHLHEISTSGVLRDKITKQEMKGNQIIKGKSYPRFGFYDEKAKKCKTVAIHRLVATAFIPNPLNLPFVNHIDGDMTNANVFNLEWIDRKHNSLHAVHVLGKKVKGFDITRIDDQGNRINYPSIAALQRENPNIVYESFVKACKNKERYAGYMWEKEDSLFEFYEQQEGEKELPIPFIQGFNVTTFGRVYNTKTKVVRKPLIASGSGYHCVGIRGQTYLVHRLICQVFFPEGNVDGKMVVNHKDGNKLNNRLENLEWATRSQNNKHALQTGLISTKSIAAYNDEGIIAVFPYTNVLTREIGMNTDIGSACKKGATCLGHKWKHITKEEYLAHKDKCKELILYHNYRTKKAVGKFNPEGEMVHMFESVKEASESVGIKSIGDHLKSGKLYKGYYWKYVDNPKNYIKLTVDRINKINEFFTDTAQPIDNNPNRLIGVL